MPAARLDRLAREVGESLGSSAAAASPRSRVNRVYPRTSGITNARKLVSEARSLVSSTIARDARESPRAEFAVRRFVSEPVAEGANETGTCVLAGARGPVGIDRREATRFLGSRASGPSRWRLTVGEGPRRSEDRQVLARWLNPQRNSLPPLGSRLVASRRMSLLFAFDRTDANASLPSVPGVRRSGHYSCV